MVACVVRVTWDELVVDDVVETLAAVKVFKVGARLTELLEKPAESNISSLLVCLLV
jgi:hypothetical protein